MSHAMIGGQRWYYELEGPQNAPVAVFANGVLADTRVWSQHVPMLSKRYRVLTFDFPGQGQSDALCRSVTVAEQAEGAASLLEHLKLDSAHWIGASYGGEVGLYLAIEHPKRLRSLIVADSVDRVDANLAGRVNAWLAAARSGDPGLLFRVCLLDIFSPDYVRDHARAIEAARRQFHKLNLTSVVHLLERFGELELPHLDRIRAPVLLLCGELDTLKPPRAMQAMADRIPQAEYLTVPGAGHALSLEKPEAFMTACLGFLTKQEA